MESDMTQADAELWRVLLELSHLNAGLTNLAAFHTFSPV